MEKLEQNISNRETGSKGSQERRESISNAERNVATTFTERMKEVLDRIGENPYHQGFDHLA